MNKVAFVILTVIFTGCNYMSNNESNQEKSKSPQKQTISSDQIREVSGKILIDLTRQFYLGNIYLALEHYYPGVMEYVKKRNRNWSLAGLKSELQDAANKFHQAARDQGMMYDFEIDEPIIIYNQNGNIVTAITLNLGISNNTRSLNSSELDLCVSHDGGSTWGVFKFQMGTYKEVLSYQLSSSVVQIITDNLDRYKLLK
jgi:hypothetical protein